MEEQLLKLPPFECDNVPVSQLRQKWIDYKKQFQYVADAIGKKKRRKLKRIFLALAGRQLQRVYESLPGGSGENTAGGEDDFKSMISSLDEYFAPKRHDTFERYSFWSLKPSAEETLDKFLLRAKQHANKCHFGSSENESRDVAVIDIILMLAPPELRRKILEKSNIDMDELTKLVNTHFTVQHQVRELNLSDSGFGSVLNASYNPASVVNRIFDTPGSRWSQNRRGNECGRCGGKLHKSDDFCPAKHAKCRICNYQGHYAKRCKTDPKKRKLDTAYVRQHPPKKSKINSIEESGSPGSEIESQHSSFIFAISDNHDELVWFKVGQAVIEMMIDSGSKHNIIDERTWEYLRDKNAHITNIRPSTKRLSAYAQSGTLIITCTFDAEINVVDEAKEAGITANFLVVKDGKQNLLGRETAKQLGVLLVGLPSVIGSTVPNSVGEITGKDTDKFPTIKGIKIRIDIDESIAPVAQHVRRVPIALRQLVEDQLSKLLRRGIIEKVLGPSPWVSPMVVVIKDGGEVRLCVDMRRVNVAIKREHHVIPTLDDLLSSASEHFQRIIEQILSGCPNSFNYQDDIFVYGKTEQEHNEALKAVLKALEDHNVILNLKKCKFKTTETEFLGHTISQNGVKPTESKIAAVCQFRSPSSAEEVRSFLGLVGYVGRFIPDLATKTFELRQLMSSDQKLEWLAKHEIAFSALKKAVCTAPVLGFFDNRRRTRVVVDASPVGLGAVLLQYIDELEDRPTVISYASKSLSSAERRYCQTEKEALAIVWSVEKFQLYLIGREFELETDHRLQPFKFRIVYKPGKSNIADPLSRLSASADANEVDISDDQIYINAITESVAIDVSEIRDALDSDPELHSVKRALISGSWSDECDTATAKEYAPFQKELSLLEGYVIRGCRLVVPRSLRSRMLQLAHEGHSGETSMTSRLRDRVWWPGMDKDAKKVVKDCEGCRLVGKPSLPEPMRRRRMPSEPWIDVAMDFLGPFW
ncbi:uncharacterized protein K02A2.6-like [Topomyia yanbarensis]|uniref:uncharacterized protein K02A2.6-like n=1 Tax=Topomyia yanbarensis TaxID=2498891 RepID=UPI00273BDD2E|nr:uncharacterized protein K02A2.6-like [Topomyia yanbarensis]